MKLADFKGRTVVLYFYPKDGTPGCTIMGPKGAITIKRGDMVLIDLNDTAYLPYNSAARQLVYTEAGRGVESVIVDGRVVIKGRKVAILVAPGVEGESVKLKLVDGPFSALTGTWRMEDARHSLLIAHIAHEAERALR